MFRPLRPEPANGFVRFAPERWPLERAGTDLSHSAVAVPTWAQEDGGAGILTELSKGGGDSQVPDGPVYLPLASLAFGCAALSRLAKGSLIQSSLEARLAIKGTPRLPAGVQAIIDPLMALIRGRSAVDLPRAVDGEVLLLPLLAGLLTMDEWSQQIERAHDRGWRTVLLVRIYASPPTLRWLSELANEGQHQESRDNGGIELSATKTKTEEIERGSEVDQIEGSLNFFHAPPPDLRTLASRAHGLGLRWWLEPPRLAPTRAARNLELAAQLALLADLEDELDTGEGEIEGLRQAARRLEMSEVEVTALIREDNLKVLDWLDARARAILEEWNRTNGVDGPLPALERVRALFVEAPLSSRGA